MKSEMNMVEISHDESCCAVRVLSSFNLYRFKMKYISKEICRVIFYDTLSKYLSKGIMFHTATTDIIKRQSQKEILEKILDYDTERVYYTELENILHLVTGIIINFVKDILVCEDDCPINDTTMFFANLATYVSLLYESLHITEDKTVIFTEDIRCQLYEDIETKIIDALIKKGYKVSVQVLSISNETRYSDDKVTVSNITFDDYQKMLSEINNGTVLL